MRCGCIFCHKKHLPYLVLIWYLWIFLHYGGPMFGFQWKKNKRKILAKSFGPWLLLLIFPCIWSDIRFTSFGDIIWISEYCSSILLFPRCMDWTEIGKKATSNHLTWLWIRLRYLRLLRTVNTPFMSSKPRILGHSFLTLTIDYDETLATQLTRPACMFLLGFPGPHLAHLHCSYSWCMLPKKYFME